MENPYARAPLQVVFYDAAAGGAPGLAVFFLGRTPKAVLEAARRAARTAAGGWTWPPAAAAALRKYYGAGWRTLLSPAAVPARPLGRDGAPATGGAPDFDAFGAPDFDAVGEEPPPPGAEVLDDDTPRPGDAPGAVYSDLATYPEDTFADLKLKVYAATGVAPYRQHLFYERGDGSVATTSRLALDGVPVPADVRRLAAELAGAKAGRDGAVDEAVAGLPVLRALEARREELAVEVFDARRTLALAPGAYARRVFVADLDGVLGGSPARRDALAAALADPYQADLLYYGLVLRYWPGLPRGALRLAAEAAVDAGARRELGAAFPELAPGGVEGRLRAEQDLLDRVYAAARPPPPVAVAAAVVTVAPRGALPVDVRNVFDGLATSERLPAVVARLEGGGVARKTHVAAAARGGAAVARFLAAPPGRGAPAVAAAVALEPLDAARDPGRPARLVSLTVHADGRYAVGGEWRENARVGFDGAVRELSAAVRGTLEAVNRLGAAAFPLGGGLDTPEAAAGGAGHRLGLGGLTVSASWPHPLSAEGFRELRGRLRELERAGVLAPRAGGAGGLAFYFRKGAARGPGDPGRPVRVVHRATDVRVEAAEVDAEEGGRVFRYLFAFLDGLLRGPGRLAALRPDEAAAAARPAGPSSRLRRLQERDPDLFDLRRHDEAATVYSVICQGDRQPLTFSEEEAKALPPPRRKALVRHWNMTWGRPAYYLCPSRRFPHLSFRVGEHPLGFCLPCCKKVLPAPGSRAAETNRRCLEAKGNPGAVGDDAVASRHVLAYGKEVPPGRASEGPRLLAEGLLFGALPPGYVFRLLGVPQHTPSVPDAGFFFALAAALDVSPAEFAAGLAETVEAVRDTFWSLGGGAAAAAGDAAALAAALAEAFGDRPVFTPLSPGGVLAGTWRELVADLVRIRYDLEVVVCDDPRGDGDVVLGAGPAAAARLRGDGGCDVAVVVAHPGGTFPFVAMNQRDLPRPGADGRAFRVKGAARRFFGPGPPPPGEPADGVFEAVRAAVLAAPGDTGCAADALTLAAAEALAGASARPKPAGWALRCRLVNLRDMCYGVVLAEGGDGESGSGKNGDGRDGALVYLPVAYSSHAPAKGVVAVYGPRPGGAYPAAALARALAALAKKGAPVAAAARLEGPGGACVGFVAACGLLFFHDPAPAEGLPWGGAPPAPAPYDLRAVDGEIYAAAARGGEKGLPPPAAALARRGRFRHQLYRLLLAELSGALRGERDAATRGALAALVARTRFDAPASLAAFRGELDRLTAGFPEDAAAVRRLAAALHARVGPGALPKALREAIEATPFGFDLKTLAALRASADAGAVAAELRRVLAPRVELVGPDAAPAELDAPNVYVACGADSGLPRPHCNGKRLRVPADRYDGLVSVLAADVLNPAKDALFASAAAGVADPLRFVARPGEKITLSAA